MTWKATQESKVEEADKKVNIVGAAVGANTSFKTRHRKRNVRYTHTELESAVKTVVGTAQLLRAARDAAMEIKQEQPISMPELVKKLTVPPAKRTDVDCKLMADALFPFVSSMEAWKDGFFKADALSIARHAELQTVDANQTVFLQGEIGDEFYFVLQGSVAIKLHNEVIKILGEKTSFGELAMQCKCERSASVLGAEDGTRLLVIRKKLYHRHLGKTHRKETSSKMEFIKKLNTGHLTPVEVACLCACIRMQKVTKNQKICSFNGPAKFLYYLIEGRAEQHSCDKGELLQKLLRGPRLRAQRKENEPQMHRLTTLVAGQIFGEASWVHGDQAMTTVIARSDCKLWVLPFEHVNKMVEKHVQVRKHLEELASAKLQFRLYRFNTVNTIRHASKCYQSVVKRTSRTKAWTATPETKMSSLSSPYAPSLFKVSSVGTHGDSNSNTVGRRRTNSVPVIKRTSQTNAWTATPETKMSSLSSLSSPSIPSLFTISSVGTRPKNEDSSGNTAGRRRTDTRVTRRMLRVSKSKSATVVSTRVRRVPISQAASPGIVQAPGRQHSLPTSTLPLVSDFVRRRRRSRLKCRFSNKSDRTQPRARPGRTHVLEELQPSKP